MNKVLDLNKSVYDLCKENPELIEIFKSIGMEAITRPGMLHSVGRLMSIPKGCEMRGIDIHKVTDALETYGYECSLSDEVKRNAMIKDYLKRLGEGEDIENVRKDFVDNFKDVDAAEIMKAEQELMAEGTPVEEVQKLCDVHSALFHGATREEKIAQAEAAVHASLAKETDINVMALIATKGHPLYTFTMENRALDDVLDEAINNLHKNDDLTNEELEKTRAVAIHYAKKGDLLYPNLKVKYGISGPSDVMWGVDDEIRDELAKLVTYEEHSQVWKERALVVLTRAKEMIYKETNILLPLCAKNYCADEWKQMYLDLKDYAPILDVKYEVWEAGEAYVNELACSGNDIQLGGGHMSAEQLTAMLNTIPLEISFIDADNINRYFNEGPKMFKRPASALDRDVFSCHPPKIEAIVRNILQEFRSGAKNVVPVWMEKNGKTYLVQYMAVRNKEGKYMGTMEIVQDMEFVKEHYHLD